MERPGRGISVRDLAGNYLQVQHGEGRRSHGLTGLPGETSGGLSDRGCLCDSHGYRSGGLLPPRPGRLRGPVRPFHPARRARSGRPVQGRLPVEIAPCRR
ncbi:MAG: hypothetical protein MZV64_28650 [Ignavibacteriales bacterium]|nr:hypothetical protein [Ignavibacteriales bacterium]